MNELVNRFQTFSTNWFSHQQGDSEEGVNNTNIKNKLQAL